MARRNLATAGLADAVEIVEGSAANTLARLPGPFDLVFLDADRPSYLRYLELVVPKLRLGGLLVADNVLTSTRPIRSQRLHRVESKQQDIESLIRWLRSPFSSPWRLGLTGWRGGVFRISPGYRKTIGVYGRTIPPSTP